MWIVKRDNLVFSAEEPTPAPPATVEVQKAWGRRPNTRTGSLCMLIYKRTSGYIAPPENPSAPRARQVLAPHGLELPSPLANCPAPRHPRGFLRQSLSLARQIPIHLSAETYFRYPPEQINPAMRPVGWWQNTAPLPKDWIVLRPELPRTWA